MIGDICEDITNRGGAQRLGICQEIRQPNPLRGKPVSNLERRLSWLMHSLARSLRPFQHLILSGNCLIILITKPHNVCEKMSPSRKRASLRQLGNTVQAVKAP